MTTLPSVRGAGSPVHVLTVALLLVLGACSAGTDEPGTTPDDATESTPKVAAPHREVGVFSGAGTLVDPTPAIAMPGPASVRSWAQELALPDGVVGDLTRSARAAEVGADETLASAVLHVGCEAVEEYTVRAKDGLVRLVPVAPGATVDCDEVVTSVALVVLATDLFDAGG